MVVAMGQQSVKKHQGHTLIKAAIIRPAIALPGLLQRLWWHTKAYSVGVGILLLLGGSLIVLRLHSFYRGSFKRAPLTDSSPVSLNVHHD